jgi:hypothetical protein
VRKRSVANRAIQHHGKIKIKSMSVSKSKKKREMTHIHWIH